MRLLLAAIFLSVVLGLVWKDYGPRQRWAMTVVAFAVTTLYFVFAARLM